MMSQQVIRLSAAAVLCQTIALDLGHKEILVSHPTLTITKGVILTLQGPGLLLSLQSWNWYIHSNSYQSFSSVPQSCPTLCDHMDWSTPGFPVHHQLQEPSQTHVHRIGDAIQPSHPLLSPSPPAFNLSQHQGLFQWVSSSHQVAKVLEFQLQHQSFQEIFMTDFL